MPKPIKDIAFAWLRSLPRGSSGQSETAARWVRPGECRPGVRPVGLASLAGRLRQPNAENNMRTWIFCRQQSGNFRFGRVRAISCLQARASPYGSIARPPGAR
jgi:hypothetical protein